MNEIDNSPHFTTFLEDINTTSPLRLQTQHLFTQLSCTLFFSTSN